MSKICFIVGHGTGKKGKYDSGAVSKDGKFHEFRIAKEIAKYAQEYYNANYNEKCDLMNYDGSIYLADRITRANKGNYDFIAEFHLNAGGGTGTECFYSKISADGKKYAQAISKAISYEFNVKNRGAKTKLNSSGKDYFGIIRQTNTETVLIETLFIDTVSDLVKINTASGQKRCGEAIAKAVAEVRGVKRKDVSVAKPKPSKPKPIDTTDFLPSRGYFRYGDKGENVAKIAEFMHRVFPSYAKSNVLGKFYGINLRNAIKEFQRRTDLTDDGCIGPITLKKLADFGFKY